MARNLNVDDMVYVPKNRIGLSVENGSAFHHTKVLEKRDRSIKVALPKQAISDWITAGCAHRDLGVLILRVGDFETETTLLDPLAKSLLQYCRLLLPDDQVHLEECRSHAELSHRWPKLSPAYSHVLLVAHGSKNAVKFGVDGWSDPTKWDELIDGRGQKRKIFMSLACQTGYQAFAGEFSRLTCCSYALAPFHSVHGAVASQFYQTFLAYHLLEGESAGVAFKHASDAVPGGKSFRLWQNGKRRAGPKQ